MHKLLTQKRRKSMRTDTVYIHSCDKKHKLRTKIYIPDGGIKGIFQVVHGMTEHIDRYDRLMRDMAEDGYVTFGHDHLGHKGSVLNDSELGFISSQDGWDILCRDTAEVYAYVRKLYPSVPYVLFGHSMGSFIVRITAQKYLTPDRLIVMGTGGPNPLSGVGLSLIKLIKKTHGERHISPFIYSMAFGAYNKRFAGDGIYGWITSDERVREEYSKDKYCTFKFTVSAMGDLMMLLQGSNKPECADTIAKKHIPVLLVSGSDDPVGDYGRGVYKVYHALHTAGADVTMKLYDGYRHEILNDASYTDTVRDIKEFISKEQIHSPKDRIQ